LAGTLRAFTLPILAYYSKSQFVLLQPGRKPKGTRPMILSRSNTFVIAAGAALLLATPALAQSPTTGAQLLGQYGDWGAYSASPGGKKVCFALAKPTQSATNPPNRPRDPAYLFVSTRPAEKVKEEISVIIGYPFKQNSDATIEIGATNFALYTQNDGAWIKNAAEEARMLEAMRKGQDLTVRGESGRGAKTTDVFSLKGISQALDRAAQECK
jgi:invasion protein IalB